jgi:hypothetical protein
MGDRDEDDPNKGAVGTEPPIARSIVEPIVTGVTICTQTDVTGEISEDSSQESSKEPSQVSSQMLKQILDKITEMSLINDSAFNTICNSIEVVKEKVYLLHKEVYRPEPTVEETPMESFRKSLTPQAPGDASYADATKRNDGDDGANNLTFQNTNRRDRSNMQDMGILRDNNWILDRPRTNTQTSQTMSRKDKRKETDKTNDKDKPTPTEALMAKAARTIGLKPISAERIEMHADTVRDVGQVSSEDDVMIEARQLAVKEFLAVELMMQEETIDSLKVDEIFVSKKGKMKDTLYVRMEDKKSASIVYGHARFIRNESVESSEKVSLEKFIPHQAFQRYQAVEQMAYEARKDKKTKTDVRIGQGDFQLRTKPKGDTKPWGEIIPLELPDSFPIINPHAFTTPVEGEVIRRRRQPLINREKEPDPTVLDPNPNPNVEDSDQDMTGQTPTIEVDQVFTTEAVTADSRTPPDPRRLREPSMRISRAGSVKDKEWEVIVKKSAIKNKK